MDSPQSMYPSNEVFALNKRTTSESQESFSTSYSFTTRTNGGVLRLLLTQALRHRTHKTPTTGNEEELRQASTIHYRNPAQGIRSGQHSYELRSTCYIISSGSPSLSKPSSSWRRCSSPLSPALPHICSQRPTFIPDGACGSFQQKILHNRWLPTSRLFVVWRRNIRERVEGAGWGYFRGKRAKVRTDTYHTHK